LELFQGINNMDSQIKSGKELLDDFFDNISKLPGVDATLADKMRELYKEGKLTNKNISNVLSKLREENVPS